MLSGSRFYHAQGQKMKSISRLLHSAFRCGYGIFDSKSECFPVVYRYRPTNILSLAFPKSATPPQPLLP